MRTTETTSATHLREPCFHVKARVRGTNFCSTAELPGAAAWWQRAGQ